MSVAYRIQDEPTGSRSSPLIFNPFWPLLGVMLAGTWLGVLMFAANAVTLRGQSWRRELALAIAIPLGSCVLLFAIGLAMGWGHLPEIVVGYALLLITTWKLALAYWIFFLQQSSFQLYEYFGGDSSRGQSLPLGAALVVGGSFLRSQVLEIFQSPYWIFAIS